MSEVYEVQKIEHDPKKKVDLTQNTIAAYQRAKWAIDSALDIAVQDLHSQGMPKDDPLLVWQLVGVVLRRRFEQLEATAFGLEEKAPPLPGVGDVEADSEE